MPLGLLHRFDLDVFLIEDAVDQCAPPFAAREVDVAQQALAGQAQLLHDADGAFVVGAALAGHAVQLEVLEGGIEHRCRDLAAEALFPILGRDTEADLALALGRIDDLEHAFADDLSGVFARGRRVVSGKANVFRFTIANMTSGPILTFAPRLQHAVLRTLESKDH